VIEQGAVAFLDRRELLQELGELIRSDNDFFAVTRALGHLTYLYVHADVLQTVGRADVAALIAETFARGLWLLESLGQVTGRDQDLLAGLRALLDACEWLVAYHEDPAQPIVTLDEYLSRAKQAIASAR
jgi:hypothetical protein